MLIRHTDVLVIGGELAGAVAAAVCARTGRRVTVLEEGEGDDHEAVGGVLVPPLDELWPHLEAQPHALALLDALGQKQDLKRTLPQGPVALQVIDARHRLDLMVDPQRRAQDLERELTGLGAPTASALAATDDDTRAVTAALDGQDILAVDGFFATRKARAVWKDHGARSTPAPLQGLEGAAGFVRDGLHAALAHAAPADRLPAWAEHRLLHAVLQGVHGGAQGPRRALRHQLLDAARQRGAEIIREDRAAALVVEGGRIGEVRLAGRTDALVARVVVDAGVARDLRERISPEKHARRLDEAQDPAKVVLHRAWVTWVVRRAGLPPGLSDHAVLLSTGDAPGQGPALLSVVRSPLHWDSRKPVPELAVLCISTRVPAADIRAAQDRLEARLHALMPFTRAHLVETKRMGNAALPLARSAVYQGPPEPERLGGRGLNGGLKSLVRAGRDVAPILGMDGEVWAGQAAAVVAERLLKKRSWFSGAGADQGASAP